MKDNRKCITISLPTSIWSLSFEGIEFRKHFSKVYIYEDDLQLGKLKENCLLLQLYRKLRKMFLSPRRESNLLPSEFWQLNGQSVSPETRRLRVRFPFGAQKYFSEFAIKLEQQTVFHFSKGFSKCLSNIILNTVNYCKSNSNSVLDFVYNSQVTFSFILNDY